MNEAELKLKMKRVAKEARNLAVRMNLLSYEGKEIPREMFIRMTELTDMIAEDYE